VPTACFVAGTPVRLRYGCKPIEQVQKGDRILSRDQYNPSGPVVEQVVEETFIRTAPVIRLRVCGQELRPTGEHPFYVPGRGWVLAWSLRPGDVLHTLEGEAVRVERVEDKGEVERVYNVRVRELQTYFVGGDAWGFALWSHNTNGHQAGSVGNPPQGARILQTDPNGKWVIFEDAAGAKKIQFDVTNAENVAKGPLGPGRGTSRTGAFVGSDGKVYVVEGMHRLEAAQAGAQIASDKGGVVGLVGWLEYYIWPPGGG
jgi:hypothetical protein